ncbi:6371_t:CDS:2 [Scutellospora calospora]|uniref:6371_t:CDS:1 n=1 Tax=Scutellospora calospora TaxID=85575 RepID=A0ACA9L8N4_9GLOM|nr:6371_t:CDS:2 [Scutellospora calospora]
MEQSQVFTCQRCKHTLRIDDTLVDLGTTSVDILLAPLSEEVVRTPDSTTVDRRSETSEINKSSKQAIFNNIDQNGILVPNKRSGSSKNLGLSRSPNRDISTKESFLLPSESYVMLSRSQVAQPLNNQVSPEHGTIDTNNDDRQRASISYRLKVANRLFDLMSSRSEIDHPMCQECTDMLLDSLSKQLTDASRERDCYIDFLKKINVSVISDAEQENLQKEIQEIRSGELAAIKTLKDIECDRDALKKELATLEEEARELDKLEESYWQEFNDFHIQLQAFQNERDSVNLKYDHDAKQLEKLQRTNVYNDTFGISHDGNFGTINGFRLGRLPDVMVDWNEINAAWGQTLLLLATIANKLNFTFKNYRLIPLGSFSKIEHIDGEKKTTYELYGSGDIAIGRLFLNRRFDHAMVAFLNCLQQLGDYAERQEHNFKLPYRISKDKIGDASIRLQFNQFETWTKALKYTLTNTKWILAYASSTFS